MIENDFEKRINKYSININIIVSFTDTLTCWLEIQGTVKGWKNG
jgi:hypothetical protein